jgi:peptidoglycan/LPS O-acetylase OafA/YrhL
VGLSPVHRTFNKDIAVLRGVAILLVLGYHLFPGKLPWGFVGVDVFFVISGYLIAQILGNDTSWRKVGVFYLNRARRIYPALVVVLGVGLVVGFAVLLDDEYAVLLDSTAFSLLQLQNFYEMSRSGYFVDAVNFRPLLHLWSLGVEFQFYIAFPLLIILGRRASLSLVGVSFLLAGVSLLLGAFLPVAESADKFFLPVTRFWELALGAICFLLMAGGWQARGVYRWLALALSLLCWLGVALWVRSDPGYPGLLALLPTLGAVASLVARPASVLDSRLLRPLFFIAAISYSLYLWHFPIIELARLTYGSLTVEQRLVILLASFAAASVTDLYLVPRILRAKKSCVSLSTSVLGLLTCSVALVVSMSALQRPVEARNANFLNNINFSVDYKFGCEFLTFEHHKEDRCRYEAMNGRLPSYAILGDSLANSFTTVFDALAQQDPGFARYLQIGRGLCPMVPGIGDAACQSMTARALEFLAQPSSPQIVLIAGQWPLYIREDMPEPEAKKFLSGLESLLDSLTAAGKRLVFVHVVPLGALPRTCIRRLSSSDPASCDTPLGTALARQSGYKGQVDSILKRFKVLEFDPAAYLCDEKKCSVFGESDIFYLDDSHLSRGGGHAIAQKSGDWFADKLTLGNQ